MNDTTRELGGALGIAVFGSIVSSVYRANVDVSGLGLPASASSAIDESVGAAVGTAARIGGETGQAIVARAASAFTEAVNVMSAISVVIVVASAIVVARTFSAAKERAAAGGDEVVPELAPTAVSGAAAD
jgi:hypothetical protein